MDWLVWGLEGLGTVYFISCLGAGGLLFWTRKKRLQIGFWGSIVGILSWPLWVALILSLSLGPKISKTTSSRKGRTGE